MQLVRINYKYTMDLESFDECFPGEIVPTVMSGGSYDAFKPDPLPPEIDMRELTEEVSRAARSLGKLHGIGPRAGSKKILIEPFVRKEALESSQIEGTQATLSDIYAFEAGQQTLIKEARKQGTQEVINYLNALNHGLRMVSEEDRITLDVICGMHDRLLSEVRGDRSNPGKIRERQNFIGSGGGIDEATYVPPPPNEVMDLMQDLVKYTNKRDDLPPLVSMGLIHYQFETIHPFLDGNGRLGRLLVSLLLQRDNLLPEPYLYLSSFFNKHRSEYINHLQNVRLHGEWREWLLFFLNGIKSQAEEAFRRANLLVDLREEYQERYRTERSENILELVICLFEKPYIDVNTAQRMVDANHSTANRLISRLEDDGVLTEVTGKDRNRFYRANEIFRLISEPIENLEK